MLLLTVALAFFVAASPADAANVAFENKNATGHGANPVLVDDGMSLQFNGTLEGLGNLFNSGGIAIIHSQAFGLLDEVCINGGQEAAPGQNKFVSTDASMTDVSDVDEENGSLDFGLSAGGDGMCGCGVEDGSSFQKKEKGKLTTYTCPGDVACCQGVDPDDAQYVSCPAGCDCRAGEDFETCPNGKNWNQYVTGLRFIRVVLDLEMKDSAGVLLEVQRQECFVANANGGDRAGSDDGTIPDADVTCWQCELCRNSCAANYAAVVAGTSGNGTIADGCAGFNPDPSAAA